MRLTSDRTANRIRSNSNSYTAGFVLKMDGCTQPWDTRKNRAAAQHATRESSSFARTPSWYLSLMRELKENSRLRTERRTNCPSAAAFLRFGIRLKSANLKIDLRR